jgi:pantoate--beta-alanine ligase
VTTLLQTVADMRAACDAARARGARLGLVPTMGFLHEGHRSLMRAARARTDVVAATIFVNPLQFAPGEDLDRYPRDLDGDLAACREERVDLVFHPSVEEMYPLGPPATTVHVEGLTQQLCGRSRPTHFDGVTTVVTKLFAIAGPCTAFFGHKDHQQLVVVRRMVADLDLPVDVVGCPIVREPDGLALSSRNRYLDGEQRAAARSLSRSLLEAVDAVRAGERDAASVRALVRDVLEAEPLVTIDYVEVRDADDLTAVSTVEGHVLVAVAAHVGTTRLIDNVRLRVGAGEVDADLGIFVPAAASLSEGAGAGARES